MKKLFLFCFFITFLNYLLYNVSESEILFMNRFLFFFFFFFELEPLRGRDPIFSGIINIRNVDFSIKKCNFSHIEIILIGWKNLCYPISKYRSLLCLINTHETILILNLSSFV